MNDGVSFDEGYQDDDAYDTRPLASGEHRQYTASDYSTTPADDLSVDFAEPFDTAELMMPRTGEPRVVDLIRLPRPADVGVGAHQQGRDPRALDDGVAACPTSWAARWLLKERDEFRQDPAGR
jgi:hypothetical protein